MKNITLPLDEIKSFSERHHIRRLALFGSVLRDDFGPDSDVDVLVEFDPDAVVTFFDMGAMQMELSAIIGRRVDLRTPEDLSRYFRRQVLETAEVQYERTG